MAQLNIRRNIRKQARSAASGLERRGTLRKSFVEQCHGPKRAHRLKALEEPVRAEGLAMGPRPRMLSPETQFKSQGGTGGSRNFAQGKTSETGREDGGGRAHARAPHRCCNTGAADRTARRAPDTTTTTTDDDDGDQGTPPMQQYAIPLVLALLLIYIEAAICTFMG